MSKREDGPGSLTVEMVENNDHEKFNSNAYEHQGEATLGKTKEQKALVLKTDLCIVPLAALCYLVSYMVQLALSHLHRSCLTLYGIG